MKSKYIKLDDVKRLLEDGYYVPDKPFDAIRKLPYIEVEAEDPVPKLLPCPVCGSNRVVCNSKSGSWGYENPSARVVCNSCGISILFEALGNDSAEDAEREAIQRWNNLQRRK